MCGIIGGITRKNFSSDLLLKTIGHRGPDNNGFFSDGNTFLGHSRLSIQDLSSKANHDLLLYICTTATPLLPTNK